MQFLYIALAFIIVLGLVAVYRVLTLASIVKYKGKEEVGKSNTVNAILFPIVFIVSLGLIFWYSGIAKVHFLPEAASLHGLETDYLFWLTMGIILVVFLITHILLFFFPYFYRYKPDRKGYFYFDNHKIELAWTIIPAIVMTILVVSGSFVWTDLMKPAPPDAVVVEIMGKQFNWEVRYPGLDGKLGNYSVHNVDATNGLGIDFKDPASMDDFITREIHIPKGKTILFKIRSRDVLHSVFLPHFRVKMDAVPGMPTQFKFVPTLTTAEAREKYDNPDFQFELACTEVCGRSHYAMKKILVVDELEEFEKWYQEQKSWASKNPDYLQALQEKGQTEDDKVQASLQ